MKTLCFLLCIATLFCNLNLFAQNQLTSLSNINTNDYVEFAPTLSADGKTMIFQSNRLGSYKLFETTYNAQTGWSEPKPLEEINNIDAEVNLIGGPCLSADGNTLYFSAIFKSGMGDMDIYYSKRQNNKWSKPVNIGSPVNTSGNESFPSISPDGKKLFYTTHIVSGSDEKCFKIMMSEQDAQGKWTTPKEISYPLNTACNKAPRIVYDNKNLIFAAKKNDGSGYDLYRTRLNSDGTWSEPISLDFANSTEDELYAWLLPTEEFIYYTAKGDIIAKKVPNEYKLHGISYKGKIIDIETKEVVNANIYVIDSLSKDTLQFLKSTVDGAYTIDFGAAKLYKLRIHAEKYWPYTEAVYASVEDNFKELEKNIELKPKRREVRFNVKDSESNKGLKVKVKVTNLDTKEENIMEAFSGPDGKYVVSLREGNKYNIEISSSEGYAFTSTSIEVPITAEASNKTNTDGTMDMQAPEFEIKVQPLKDNTKLTLKDIYFDFNKFTLREESYIELNRVVGLMKENPSARVEIAAHTDDVGSDEFNLKLSERRAQEIVKYLVSQKIHPNRLIAKGYGKQRPVVKDTTEEARAKNRRVELKIIDIK
ncbi:MAG: OmpA family protein [Cytophagaceae bacterium]|nr:OmpA family protein [Cytophagaceae bacterium]MDW8455885.1 OmpA family protein [Cytophagaceae bacterium]